MGEVDEMIRTAAQFEEEDKRMRETVEARNSLEGTAFSLLSQIDDDEKLGGKLSEEDKDTIREAAEEATSWVSDSPDAELEDYKEKLQELNEIAQPIVSDLYEGGEGGEDYGDDDDDEDHDEL